MCCGGGVCGVRIARAMQPRVGLNNDGVSGLQDTKLKPTIGAMAFVFFSFAWADTRRLTVGGRHRTGKQKPWW